MSGSVIELLSALTEALSEKEQEIEEIRRNSAQKVRELTKRVDELSSQQAPIPEYAPEAASSVQKMTKLLSDTAAEVVRESELPNVGKLADCLVVSRRDQARISRVKEIDEQIAQLTESRRLLVEEIALTVKMIVEELPEIAAMLPCKVDSGKSEEPLKKGISKSAPQKINRRRRKRGRKTTKVETKKVALVPVVHKDKQVPKPSESDEYSVSAAFLSSKLAELEELRYSAGRLYDAPIRNLIYKIKKFQRLKSLQKRSKMIRLLMMELESFRVLAELHPISD